MDGDRATRPCGMRTDELRQRGVTLLSDDGSLHAGSSAQRFVALQYLPDPYPMLDSLPRHRIRLVIVDRIPFLQSNRERLTIQHVPGTIYPEKLSRVVFQRTPVSNHVHLGRLPAVGGLSCARQNLPRG